MNEPIRFLVITVSDRCSRNEAVDVSGPSLAERIGKDKLGTVLAVKCVPDEKSLIQAELVTGSLISDVILTTGGTGFSDRDVTPEATRAVIEKEAPAIALAMTLAGLEKTKHAVLSRSVCGIRDRCLIINLPGSAKGSMEGFEAVIPCLKHAVALLRGSNDGVHSSQAIFSKVDLKNISDRPRESCWKMISVPEAHELIVKHTPGPRKEVVTLRESLTGHVVSEDILCKEPVPPFRASIKDGYAVLSSDGSGIRKVKAAFTAGMSPEAHTLRAGEIVRVNTGGPLPSNADAVVQVEDTKLVKGLADGEEDEVEILIAPTPGLDIRPVGADIEKGECVLRQGDVLLPAELGLLAAIDLVSIPVYRLPRVGVMSTGNELMEAGSTEKRAGCIRDSNRIMLLALLAQSNFPTLDLGIVSDDPSKLLSKLRYGLSHCDVLVSSGGVSMGERDLLKPVLTDDLGATIHFGRVDMKPGKPTTFGTCVWEDGSVKCLFCLPGNPVSAAVTFHLFVLPALRKMAGYLQDRHHLTTITARMGFDVAKLDPRAEYRRVVLDWNTDDGIPLAKSTGNQMSSRLMSWRDANGLVILPRLSDKQRSVSAGTIVKALLLQTTS